MKHSDDSWISISDMMAGLMMLFLVIAISYMLEEQQSKQKYQAALNKELHLEFELDLDRWNAEILDDNTIRFKSPDVLFAQGNSKITDEYVSILKDFYPRYINVLENQEFKDSIKEIRIEGHTSSAWNRYTTHKDSYLKNMELSQNRAMSVLKQCFEIENSKWIDSNLRANGMGSSELILHSDNSENKSASRRVEFKVVTL